MKYLATPYSHDNPNIMQLRFEQAEAITAHLMQQGHAVYSPIVHGHEMAKKFNMPTHFGFWQRYCLTMLDAASELWVVKMPGWDTSNGVQAEIEHAKQHNMTIVEVEPNNCRRCRTVTPPDQHYCHRCDYPGIDDDWREYQALIDDGYDTAQAAVMAGWRGAEEIGGDY